MKKFRLYLSCACVVTAGSFFLLGGMPDPLEGIDWEIRGAQRAGLYQWEKTRVAPSGPHEFLLSEWIEAALSKEVPTEAVPLDEPQSEEPIPNTDLFDEGIPWDIDPFCEELAAIKQRYCHGAAMSQQVDDELKNRLRDIYEEIKKQTQADSIDITTKWLSRYKIDIQKERFLGVLRAAVGYYEDTTITKTEEIKIAIKNRMLKLLADIKTLPQVHQYDVYLLVLAEAMTWPGCLEMDGEYTRWPEVKKRVADSIRKREGTFKERLEGVRIVWFLGNNKVHGIND